MENFSFYEEEFNGIINKLSEYLINTKYKNKGYLHQ